MNDRLTLEDCVGFTVMLGFALATFDAHNNPSGYLLK